MHFGQTDSLVDIFSFELAQKESSPFFETILE